MKILLENPTTHNIVRRSDKTDITVLGQAFEEVVGEFGRAMAQRAVISPRFFATGQKQVNTSDYGLTLYTLAQCSPDLKAEDCDVCLSRLLAMLSISDEQPAERVATVWCSYRHGLHRFFRGEPTLSFPANVFRGGE